MPRPLAPVEFSEHRSVMFVCPHSVNGQLTSDIRLYLSERNGENKLGRNPLEPQKTTRRDSRHKKVGLVYTEKVVMNRSLTYLQRQNTLYFKCFNANKP